MSCHTMLCYLCCDSECGYLRNPHQGQVCPALKLQNNWPGSRIALDLLWVCAAPVLIQRLMNIVVADEREPCRPQLETGFAWWEVRDDLHAYSSVLWSPTFNATNGTKIHSMVCLSELIMVCSAASASVNRRICTVHMLFLRDVWILVCFGIEYI